MAKKLTALLVALVVLVGVILIGYAKTQTPLSGSDVPMRFVFVAIGTIIVIGIYLATRESQAWVVGTREVVYMALGAALYGVFAWLFNGTVFVVPSVSQVALRPAIAIPVIFGYLFGPVVGFFTGAVGNTIGDMLSGWISPQWSFGNGLIGLIAGMVFLFADKKRSLNAVLIVAAVGALLGTLIWVLNPGEGNQMTGDTKLSFFAGISAVVGLILVLVVFYAFGKDLDVAASVVWGSLGIVLGIGFAAIADIWVNGYSVPTAIVGEFLPAAGPNLIAAAVLVPILIVAYQAVRRQSGR